MRGARQCPAGIKRKAGEATPRPSYSPSNSRLSISASALSGVSALMIGVNDEFGRPGPTGAPQEQFGLCGGHIAQAVKRMCK